MSFSTLTDCTSDTDKPSEKPIVHTCGGTSHTSMAHDVQGHSTLRSLWYGMLYPCVIQVTQSNTLPGCNCDDVHLSTVACKTGQNHHHRNVRIHPCTKVIELHKLPEFVFLCLLARRVQNLEAIHLFIPAISAKLRGNTPTSAVSVCMRLLSKQAK